MVLEDSVRMTIYGSKSLSITSKCQVSVERSLLDLELGDNGGGGYIPTRGNILLHDFLFSRIKAPDANIDIIVNFV